MVKKTEKLCSRCYQIKPIREFAVKTRSSMCKDCFREAARERYHEKKTQSTENKE